MLNIITDYFQCNPITSPLVMINVMMVMMIMIIAQNYEQDL
jgi:hypothetical protein